MYDGKMLQKNNLVYFVHTGVTSIIQRYIKAYEGNTYVMGG